VGITLKKLPTPDPLRKEKAMSEAERAYIFEMARWCQETHDTISKGGEADYLQTLEEVAANLNLLGNKMLAFQ
jgi:hypothetical protein